MQDPKSPFRKASSSKRAFTLGQIQHVVNNKLSGAQGAGRAGREVRAPAMPTLKLWSKTGFFDGVGSLEDAANLVTAKVLARSSRYEVAIKPGALQQVGEGAVDPTQSTNSNAACPDWALDLQKSVMATQTEIQAIVQQLQVISNIVNSQQQRSPAEKSIEPHEVLRAVEQLDAVRKHTLASLDREMQQIRQPRSGQPSTFEFASALDAQRILARLSNLESLINYIVHK